MMIAPTRALVSLFHLPSPPLALSGGQAKIRVIVFVADPYLLIIGVVSGGVPVRVIHSSIANDAAMRGTSGFR